MDLASVDELLTTTRSVRKRLDLTRPVPRELIERCIEIAFQAPTGSNAQGWHFVVVTDAAKRARIGELYRQAFSGYASNPAMRPAHEGGDPRAEQWPRVFDSASYLGEHLGEAPVHVIACIEGRVENAGVVGQASIYGSILPAAWSFMLAARARGLGAAWTTLHLLHEKEIAEMLGIPDTVTQAVLFPVAYFTGDTFRPATRVPASQLTHWDTW